eukprot:1831834-Alexandrium_andersonii.AAC.1
MCSHCHAQVSFPIITWEGKNPSVAKVRVCPSPECRKRFRPSRALCSRCGQRAKFCVCDAGARAA